MAVLDKSNSLIKIPQLPETMPDDGAISITLVDGIPVFRAANAVQERILYLLDKQKDKTLTSVEEQELDQYEEIDDYLSYLNRITRNLLLTSSSN